MIRKRIHKIAALTAAFSLAVSVSAAAAPETVRHQKTEETGSEEQKSEQEEGGAVGFDVNRFVLPESARVLVAVEGTGGSLCNVYAYEKTDAGWLCRVQTCGYLGRNGMSNNRSEGDMTTPIGLFQMNTPFGQKEALEGFPASYLQVNENHVWLDAANKMVCDRSARGKGEAVGTAAYAGYYDYVIDAGYNAAGIPKKGSALFLHCIKPGRTDTAGCVAIPAEQMIAIMRLYGAYGDGACYIAQAPRGTFHLIYESYGANYGLSPDGDFTLESVMASEEMQENS